MQEQNKANTELDDKSQEEPSLLVIFKKNWAVPYTRNIIIFNIFVFIGVYSFLILNALYNVSPIEHQPECIIDKFQNWTLDINQFFGNNKMYRNACMIVASLMMDIITFTMACRSIMQARCFKIVLCIGLFYAFRTWLQSIFFMRLPEHYLWEYPGFFSIGVEYFPKNDFFYSGHIGVLMICLLEFRHDKKKFLTFFALIGICLNFFVLLVTRSHYSIDLIMGLIMGHYCYLISGWCVDYVYQLKPALKKGNSSQNKKVV